VHLGLQAEFHAQNILLGLDGVGRISAIVFRDCESVDKDIPLMDDLGIGHEGMEGTHNALDRNKPDYQKRHSFMFDFKCGEYLLAPLIGAAVTTMRMNEARVIERVRGLVDERVAALPEDFFPRGAWYSYRKVMIDRTVAGRPFVEHRDPKFRSA
jgi:hypothetical protein